MKSSEPRLSLSITTTLTVAPKNNKYVDLLEQIIRQSKINTNLG